MLAKSSVFVYIVRSGFMSYRHPGLFLESILDHRYESITAYLFFSNKS